MKEIEGLLELYKKRRNDIKKFLDKINRRDNYVLGELYFCLLTPQSKAKKCRAIINEIKSRNLLFNPDIGGIRKILVKFGHRFPNKAEYIIKAFRKFENIKNNLTREWLVKNVKGLGMKEASHFLRNIGLKNIAIIDVHVLNFFKKINLFDKGNLTKKKYLELEKRFFELSKKLKIAPEELDIAIWLYQSGEKEFYG